MSASILANEPRSRREARMRQLKTSIWRVLRNPSTFAGGAIILLLIVMAAAAPLLATHDPVATNLSDRLAAPGAKHWLGTDQLGRDIYSRLLYGAQPTLAIVLLVIGISAPVGLAVGLLAGYLGGWVEALLMRLTDIVLAFPRLILALALVAVLKPGLINAVIAIAITAWPNYARIARAEALALRNAEYVLAARGLGMGDAQIMTGQIMPALLPSVAVRATLDMAGIILTAAGLGFLGLGTQPPLAEWGTMISSGRDFIFDAWWVAAVPGIAILVVSLGFNLMGDGLRDVLDPKHHE
jgi:peptide/nickel transport system permease protein